jgi:hypothetical protein
VARAEPHSFSRVCFCLLLVVVVAPGALCWWYTQELLHQRNTHSHAPLGREGKGTSGGAALGVSLGVSVPPATLPAYVDGSFRALPHLCNAIKEVSFCPILRPPCPTLLSVYLSALFLHSGLGVQACA